MERRERYDPEDIESLLCERSFDELLEEERAYVLRHLTGREEYEAMRTLLLHMRTDDKVLEPLEADPAIRDRVVSQFRAHHQPQWRVWLNSVGGMFTIPEQRSYLRPALAFGSIAMLIVAGVLIVRTIQHGGAPELAEVEQVPAAKEVLPASPTVPDPKPGAVTGTEQVAAISDQAMNTVEANEQMDVPSDAIEVRTNEQVADDASNYLTGVLEERSAEVVKDEDASFAETVSEVDQVAAKATAPASPTARLESRVVTENELARNVSIANTEMRAKTIVGSTKKERSVVPARALSDDTALLSLLGTGW